MIPIEFSLFSTEPVDSNLWGSFKPLPLGLYLSTIVFLEFSPKLVIYTIYMHSKLFVAQTNNSEDSCPENIKLAGTFQPGIFNGRYPRPRNLKKD